VHAHRDLATDIIGLDLVSSDGAPLPAYEAGASWEMHYCGRTADRLAFTDELARFGNRVQIHLDSGPEEHLFDLCSVLTTVAPDRHLYVCGPNGVMDFITISAASARCDAS